MTDLFSGSTNYEDFKRDLKKSELVGIVVLFDMTSSTDLKVQQGFPGWVTYLEKFSQIIETSFPREKFVWRKFLGDAYLFFIPSANENRPERLDKLKNNHQIVPISAEEIFILCKRVMDSYWEFYSPFSKRKRGESKSSEFREMTCAIDYGGEIINWSEFLDADGVFDPVGKTVDRCFRISSIAGPGQLIFSKDFKNLLEKGNTESLLQDEYCKFSFPAGTLKGFPTDDHVYYRVPNEDQVEYILSPDHVELVERARHLSIKAKIKLLEKRR
ncbi:hypothetical protein [Leptospira wolffii]|uniref:hypothetical protein n=1 Tax=Leptospira wolffii TaxID=409998 RepID=UPI00058E9DFA|nr:hypothetical protein [Leptospira wolffii]